MGTGAGPSLIPDDPVSGTETDCDGIDNDANGIIDDVDVGQDGICDCLRIATLGKLDTWATSGYPSELLTTWLDSRSSTKAAHLGDAQLTRELLDEYQVVVAMNVATSGTPADDDPNWSMHAYQPDEVAAMQGWIQESGGGLFTTTGYGDSGENANINTLLQPYNMAYDKGWGGSVDISEWATHPTSDGVSLVRFNNGYDIIGTGGTMVARHPKLFDAMRVQETDLGKVVMWGDEWITYDEIWNNLEQYQLERFWANVFKWLSPPAECQVPIPADIR